MGTIAKVSAKSVLSMKIKTNLLRNFIYAILAHTAD